MLVLSCFLFGEKRKTMCLKRIGIIVDKMLGVSRLSKFFPHYKKIKPACGELVGFANTLTPLALDKSLFCVDNL